MNATQLLPTKYDSLSDLQKRRADLLRDAATDGFFFQRGSQELGMLIGALNKAINERQSETRNFHKPEKKYSDEGRTARDKAKENYKTPEEKRRARSEESIRVRNSMKKGGGK